MRKVINLVLILLIAGPVIAENICEIRDISGAESDEDVFALKLMRLEWTRKANVCQIGEYEIATPSGVKSNNEGAIFLLKKGKPVFHRQGGGTYIYSPKLEDAAFENVLVHIWHGNDTQEIKRLWYQTIGSEPQINIYDTNFDGQPDFKTVWEENEIKETYKWSQDQWLRVESSKLTPNQHIKPTR